MDLTPVLLWWLIIFIVGLVGWPAAYSLLQHLPDRGFAFARPVGLLLTGYVLWLGSIFRLLQNNLGGILAAGLVVLLVGVFWQRQQQRDGQAPSMLAWLRREWRYALAVEILFGTAFVAWAIFKAYNPNVETAGGEKWMEITFINGVLNSDYFPPQDPWLSGFAISYYYFGYVLMAMLTRLSGLVSTVAFNLYIPTLFGLTLTAAFGLGANLVYLHHRPVLPLNSEVARPALLGSAPLGTGLLAALFVGILSNLEGLLEVLHKAALLPAGFWAWLDIRDLRTLPLEAGGWIPDRFMWWWRASRVLTDYSLGGQEQEVIDEFPFFSFLLGDVHPHVLALPFVLLVVALALNLLSSQRSAISEQRAAVSGQKSAGEAEAVTAGQPQPVATEVAFFAANVAIPRAGDVIERFAQSLRDSWEIIIQATGGRLAFGLYAVFVGGLSFLNTWDFPIYLAVVGLSLVVWLAERRGHWQPALWPGLVSTAMLGAAGILLYLPFYATFQSQARGLLPNLWNPTRLPQFLVFFGPFLVTAIVFLLVLAGKEPNWRRHMGWALQLTLLGPVLLMLLALTAVLVSPAGRDYVQGILSNPEVQAVTGEASIGSLLVSSLLRRLATPWTFVLLGGLLGWTLALLLSFNEGRQAGPVEISVPVKFGLMLLLVGLALPLAVEFVYLRDNFGIRMNTIFKFYFQAWVLLALVSAFAVYYVLRNLRGAPAALFGTAMVLLVAGGLFYPALAIPNKTGNFSGEPTLNGIAWVAQHYPGDYAAIEWLRANTPKNAVILEAPGAHYAAYQYTGRISAMTGRPTLLGWGGHQSQWRGNYDEPARREPDIELLYNTSDIQQAQALLDRYGISYVYVGALERERYSPQGLGKFERFMEIVFQQDDAVIYRR